MANFDVKAVGSDALAAALAALKGHANKAQPFLVAEAKKMAETGLQIVEGQASGEINEAQARILLRMQGNASQSVLTAVETIGMIAAQDAINAALGVVRGAVNKALGIALL
jgi:hypothetical protein